MKEGLLKTSLKYGALCGAFLLIIFVLSDRFGSNPLINVGHLIFDLMIFGLFIFFAQKEFKAHVSQGVLHFWQGMTIGFVVYAAGALLFASALALYLFFFPEVVINYQEAATKLLHDNAEIYIPKMGEEQFARQLEEIKNVTKGTLVVNAAIKKILAGLFVTPLISIILRKHPKSPTN